MAPPWVQGVFFYPRASFNQAKMDIQPPAFLSSYQKYFNGYHIKSTTGNLIVLLERSASSSKHYKARYKKTRSLQKAH